MSYECLSGNRPIDGENVGQLFKQIVTGTITPLETVAPNLPLDISRTIARMLVRDPGERANDLREFYQILKRYASVEAISFGSARHIDVPLPSDLGALSSNGFAHPATSDDIGIPRKRWKRLAALAAATMTLAAGVTTWFLIHTRGESSAELPPAPASAVPIAAPGISTDEPATPAPTPSAKPDASTPAKSDVMHPKTAKTPGKTPDTKKSAEPPPEAPPAPTRTAGAIVEHAPF